MIAKGQPVRIVLVDDHPIVRSGIRETLQKSGDLEVVGEAGSADEAMRVIQQLQPEVAVIDIMLPGDDGFALTASLRQVMPDLKVLLLSGIFDTVSLEKALRLGVSFALKTEPPQKLHDYILAVLGGEQCFSEPIAARLQRGPEGWQLAPTDDLTLGSLDENLRSMLALLAQGLPLKQAAKRMGITYKAADHLKQRLMKRLNVRDRMDLLRFAIREGLVKQ